MKYPVAKPDLSKLEKKYLNEAINSGWISSSGNYIDKFESQFAKKCSVDHAIAVSNGTVALHLALMALGIGKGDEVIVPSLTYIASANAVRYVGANPVFCDVSKETWCMTYESIEKVITKRTKCIIVVHLYGNVANMDQVNLLARKRNIKVIEDAAEATFAKFNRKPVGSLSDVATFSFYGNKIITSGEGGALTTNNNDLAKQIRLLKGQGMSDTKRYFFPIIGYNYRMTNICAAILCAQLERVDTLIEKRERINHLYE